MAFRFRAFLFTLLMAKVVGFIKLWPIRKLFRIVADGQEASSSDGVLKWSIILPKWDGRYRRVNSGTGRRNGGTWMNG